MTDIRKLDSRAVSNMINEYMEACQSSRRELQLKNGDVKIRQTLPTVFGLAEYMGVGFQRLYELMDISTQKALPGGDVVNADLERRKAIGAELYRARGRIAEIWIQAAAAGDVEPRIAERMLTLLSPENTVSTPTITITIQGASTDEINAWTR